MALNPYIRNWQDYPWSQHKDKFALHEQHGQDTPAYVTRDGYLMAKGFIDTNDDKEFFFEDGAIKVRQSTTPEQKLTKDLVIAHTDSYAYNVVTYQTLEQSFGAYSSPMELYSTVDLPAPHKKYKLLITTIDQFNLYLLIFLSFEIPLSSLCLTYSFY